MTPCSVAGAPVAGSLIDFVVVLTVADRVTATRTGSTMTPCSVAGAPVAGSLIDFVVVLTVADRVTATRAGSTMTPCSVAGAPVAGFLIRVVGGVRSRLGRAVPLRVRVVCPAGPRVEAAVVAEFAGGEELDDAVLHVVEAVVVGVEDRLCGVEIEGVIAARTPRHLEDPVEPGTYPRVFG